MKEVAMKDENKMAEQSLEAMSIEESLTKIEEIIEKLEQPDVTLAESLQLYKDGVTLVASCKDSITGIEKEIQILEDNEAV